MAVRQALLPRAVVLLAALAACAWFVFGIRQAHAITRAQSLLTSGNPLTPPQQRMVASLLDEAAVLNPDRFVDLLRAQLDSDRGQALQAQAVAESIVHAEPMNIEAWYWLAAHPYHANANWHALVAIGRLEPPIPHSRG